MKYISLDSKLYGFGLNFVIYLTRVFNIVWTQSHVKLNGFCVNISLSLHLVAASSQLQ